MTNLNDKQEQLLDTVRTVYADVTPVLQKMREDYEYAVYRAKKPIRDAVDAALDGRVPLARIVSDATDLTYPQKLKAWLRPHDIIVDLLLGEDVKMQTAETYAENIESIETVSRNPSDGVFKVVFNGGEYDVSAMGPDEEAWAAHDPNIPDEVYDLIAKKYPGFVVLTDEDDD